MQNEPTLPAYRWKDLRQDFLASLICLYPEAEALSLFYWAAEEICGKKRAGIAACLSDPVPASYREDFRQVQLRLSKGEPVQYVFGKAYFADLVLGVDPSVLIPRPETEELLVWACRSLRAFLLASRLEEKELRILDLCTGSGALAIALARSFPSSMVWACDISEAALRTATENARRCGAEVVFFRHDVLQACLPEAISSVGPFHLIVCNPPYVRPSEKKSMRSNVLDYEPHAALFVEEDDPLSFYRALRSISIRHLTEGGLCMAEINEAFPFQTEALFRESAFRKTELRKDMQDKYRMLKAEK